MLRDALSMVCGDDADALSHQALHEALRDAAPDRDRALAAARRALPHAADAHQPQDDDDAPHKKPRIANAHGAHACDEQLVAKAAAPTQPQPPTRHAVQLAKLGGALEALRRDRGTEQAGARQKLSLKIFVPPPEAGGRERPWVALFIGRDGVNKKRLEAAAPGATIFLRGKGCRLRSQAPVERDDKARRRQQIPFHLQNPAPRRGARGDDEDSYFGESVGQSQAQLRQAAAEAASAAAARISARLAAGGTEPAAAAAGKGGQSESAAVQEALRRVRASQAGGVVPADELEPMHVLIEAENEEALDAMRREVERILEPPVSNALSLHDPAQLAALAARQVLEGGDLGERRAQEAGLPRCLNCGGFGHLLRDCRGGASRSLQLAPSEAHDAGRVAFDTEMRARSGSHAES